MPVFRRSAVSDHCAFSLPVLPPGRKGSPLHLDLGAIERQDVVHAAVEKGAVMADEKKALFHVQVPADQFSAADIKVVGRLVDEQKPVFPREEQAELQLGLLPL